MDLRSSDQRANWHPLTALIEYEGAWADRHFFGMPFISEPPRVKGRSVVSTMHHELTHLACARTTRLGIALTFETARLLEAAEAGADLTLSAQASTLLGAYLPILEGLALFAELDADERDNDLIIPNPLPLHAQMMTLAWGRPESFVFWQAREEQIREGDWLNYFETHDNDELKEAAEANPGLLRMLFASPDSPETAHYFVGYLWIKAAASILGRLDARLSRPTVMLPFLIKLLCDHPIIAEAWQGRVNHDAIVNSLLATITSIDSQSVKRVLAALETPRYLAQFEVWDLHGFLQDAQRIYPLIATEKVARPFTQKRLITQLQVNARASAQIHFPSRTSGRLVDVTRSDGKLQFEIEVENASGEKQIASGDILSITALWPLLSQGRDAYSHFCASFLTVADQLEQRLWSEIESLVGQNVTIAGYWALTQPVLFGIVIWAEQKWFEIPFDPHWFENEEHRELTKRGLSISFEARRSFARKLEPATAATIFARQTTAALMAHMVSDPKVASKLIQKRFFGALRSQEERETLDRWVAVPLLRQELWQLEDPALSRLQSSFDFPSFPNKPQFLDMLPLITPYPNGGMT